MKLSLQDLDADLGGVAGMVLRDGVQGRVHEALAGGCLGVAAVLLLGPAPQLGGGQGLTGASYPGLGALPLRDEEAARADLGAELARCRSWGDQGIAEVARAMAGRLEAQLEADVGLLRGQLAQVTEELAAAGWGQAGQR